MARIELKQPSMDDYPNDPVGYCAAIIQAQLDYRAACFAAIDASPKNATRTEKPVARAIDTAHDFLSEHPYMRERYKKLGPLAFLEID